MGELTWSDGLLEAGFGDAEVAALVGWPSRVARMVEVEAGLARALEKVGILPPGAADAVARACDPARVDLDDLAARAAQAPTPVIPLVRALTDGADELATRWLHHGATSQDIVDTAAVLQLRDALHRVEDRLLVVGDLCADLARRHRGTVMAGRTLGQQAVPITFGLLAARWVGAVDRRVEQLRWLRPRMLVVQLGGAAGTTAVYGERGPDVASALADELGLGVADLPWHAERDRIVELAGLLTGVAATVGTIATDIVLLSQTEIGEVREPSGGGPGSSAMPHKRNPAHAVAARAASRLALAELAALAAAGADHELERAAGAWQAEWVALPSALVRTAGGVRRIGAALDGLEVDAARAAANLDRALGATGTEALASALAAHLGRSRAQQFVGELAAIASRDGRHLREVAAEQPQLLEVMDVATLDDVLDPTSSLASVPTLIDRALATHDAIREGTGSP